MEEKKKQGESHVGIVNFERRKYPRFAVDLPIEYHRVDSSVRQTGRAQDASEGGLLLYLPEKMATGQDLEIKLFFASGKELKTVELLAQVVWTDIHLGKGWGDYRTGVKFIDISSENLTQLKEFLRSLSK